MSLIDPTKVDLSHRCCRVNVLRALCRTSHIERKGVEETVVGGFEPVTLYGILEQLREAVYLGSDALESFRPVVNRIHCRHIREKSLAGTDVTGRLLPSDVLFAS